MPQTGTPATAARHSLLLRTPVTVTIPVSVPFGESRLREGVRERSFCGA